MQKARLLRLKDRLNGENLGEVYAWGELSDSVVGEAHGFNNKMEGLNCCCAWRAVSQIAPSWRNQCRHTGRTFSPHRTPGISGIPISEYARLLRLRIGGKLLSHYRVGIS